MRLAFAWVMCAAVPVVVAGEARANQCAPPSKVLVSYNELVSAAGQCRTMSLAMQHVAEVCFDASGNRLATSGCQMMIDACKHANENVDRNQADHDKNEPALADIQGGWMGQPYAIQDSSILATLDPAIECDPGAGRDRILQLAAQREAISKKHQAIHDEWQRWLQWAQKLSADCSRDAEEQARRKQEEEENAKRRAAADKKRQEETDRAAEEERRREEKARMLAERYQEQKAVADSTNAAYYEQLGTAMAGLRGGGNHPRGTSTYRHFELGVGFEVMPIYSNTGGSDIPDPYSSGTSAVGLGPHLRFGYSPYHSASFVAGLYGQGRAGGLAAVGGSQAVASGELGLEGAFGPERSWQLQWRVGIGAKYGTASGNSGAGIIDATSYGSGTASYTRIGVGVRRCSRRDTQDDRFCSNRKELLLARDSYEEGSAVTLIGRYAFLRFMAIGIEIGFSVPRAGAPDYDTDGSSTGTSFAFGITHSWDVFGDPRKGTTKQDIALAKLEDTTANRYRDLPRCRTGDELAFTGDCVPSSGGVAYGVDVGKVGLAYAFDGSVDYMTLPTPIRSRSFTVGAWLSVIKDGVAIAGGRSDRGFTIGYRDSKLVASVAGIGELAGPAVAPGAWNHVALVVEASEALFVVDDVVVARAAGAPHLEVDRLVVGGSRSGGDAHAIGHSFAGKVDELRVWPRAVGVVELGAIAFGIAPPTEDASRFEGVWGNPNTPVTTQFRRVGDEVWMVQSDGLLGVGRVEDGWLRLNYTNAQRGGFGTMDIGPETTPTSLVELWSWAGGPRASSWAYARLRPNTDDALFADPTKFVVPPGTKRPLRGGTR